jgi:hypothetical protein
MADEQQNESSATGRKLATRDGKGDRTQARAEALRANLLRRKAQQRARSESPDDASGNDA